ncbi:hypothetical protein T484DRAFT_1757453 [Baffinella frigidus]|nr:hypothetical protein T484DRAFT_1757453 [Cryptophyta sp. CCMP2293]
MVTPIDKPDETMVTHIDKPDETMVTPIDKPDEIVDAPINKPDETIDRVTVVRAPTLEIRSVGSTTSADDEVVTPEVRSVGTATIAGILSPLVTLLTLKKLVLNTDVVVDIEQPISLPTCSTSTDSTAMEDATPTDSTPMEDATPTDSTPIEPSAVSEATGSTLVASVPTHLAKFDKLADVTKSPAALLAEQLYNCFTTFSRQHAIVYFLEGDAHKIDIRYKDLDHVCKGDPIHLAACSHLRAYRIVRGIEPTSPTQFQDDSYADVVVKFGREVVRPDDMESARIV